VRTASLARLPRTGNISTSRLTAPSLALSLPQFMRVGAVAVGLGYGAVMGTFTGLVRHALGSPPRSAAELGSSPSRARAPPDDRREGPRDDSRVSPSVLSSRKVPRTDGRTSRWPPRPFPPSPPAVQKVSAAAILLRAGTSRAGGDASRVSPERGRESV